jgi:type II secretory pathway predicted ATPase ExeA/septal ring-binding cell division protein DamX
MYYAHFGLREPPFKITPNTDFFFGGGNRGPILEALVYALSQGEGIIKVTGEVGSGKTMLCSMLQARVFANVETVYLANPSVGPEEILRAIAFELGLKPAREAGRLEVMQQLHDYLLDRHAQGKQVVIFVEESQSMPIATLEEMRLLSNLETKNHKLLQLVLFGQPELDDNLRKTEIRQLRERITHSFTLSPLADTDVRDYLVFRLRAAGYRGPDLFSPAVVRTIAKASRGLTRRINLIADKALLAAFADNTHTVKPKHVRAAIRDSEFAADALRALRPVWLMPALLVALGTAIGIGGYAWHVANKPQSDAAATPAPAPVPPAPTPPASPAAAPAPEAPKAEPPSPPTLPVSAEPVPQKSAESTEKQPVIEIPPATAAAPESKVGANLKTEGRGSERLEERLAATEAWLKETPGTIYTIQLLGTDDRAQLKQYLNVLSKYIETNDVFIYRTVAKQKPSLTVVYGSYADRQAALDALSALPPQLKAYRPLLRTVNGIRAELAALQPS